MKKPIFLAEFAGTFILVFAGCGAVAAGSIHGTPGPIGVSLVFGLTVLAMIYSLGNVSGAHINPAVTIGFVLAGRLRWRAAPLYLAAQFSGAVAAGYVLLLLLPEASSYGVTMPSRTVPQALGMEVILSFILMFVILNVSTGHMEKGIMAGVAIGGTVALEAMLGGPVSGASMNPARSLGPAVASGALEHLWVYFAGPILGTVLASPTCRIIQGSKCCHVKGVDNND